MRPYSPFRNRFARLAGWACLLLLLARCASQQALTGGPKDETPPALVHASPQHQSVNYTGTTFVLEFDEYVSAANLKKELLITPLTEVGYEAKVRRETVTLTFDSLLEANTTYTFSFRKGIVDIAEKNAPPDLRLAFSTGPIIDSLELEGQVRHVLTGQPVSDATVMLYRPSDTLALLGQKPQYLASTDAEGHFHFYNLKPQAYQVLVLREKDGDLRYSKREELVGFLPQPLPLDSTTQGLALQALDYDNQPFRLLKARANKQYIDVEFGKTFASFSLQPLDPATAPAYWAVPQEERIRLFRQQDAQLDSFQVRLQAADSLGQAIDTLLMLQFRPLPRKLQEESFTASAFPKTGAALPAQDTLWLQVAFAKPVATYLPDSALLIAAGDTLPLLAQPQIDSTATQWRFPIPAATLPLALKWPKGCFISSENDTLPALNLGYRLRNAEDYAVIIGKVETWEQSFTVELLSNGKVEQSLRNQRAFRFEWVTPGEKRIRVLIDGNGDGTWDAGHFPSRRPPERVFFYEKEIPAKANWELVLDPISF
jgi:hypothetical protein